MAKSLVEVMDDPRQDVVRWKTELARLRSQGDVTTAEHMEKIITDAEFVLSRWNDPDAPQR